MNKTEIKIFLTFFLIYTYFIQWTSWGEESRFSLVRAIVEEERFEINSFYNQTGDRLYYKGNYYSDKNPGLSFIATPIYASLKFVCNLFPYNLKKLHSGTDDYVILYIRGFGGRSSPIVYYPNPGILISFSKFLVTSLTSSLTSATTILLVYKILAYFLKNERKRLLLTFTIGLGSLILPIAVIFFDHAIATFLGFLSFYLFFRFKHQTENGKYIFLVGLFAGYAIVCNFILICIGIFYSLYLIIKKNKEFLYFLLGFLLGILPILFYWYSITEAFLIKEGIYLFLIPPPPGDPTIWAGVNTAQHRQELAVLKLLFSTERGLFFYYPILLFVIPGFFFMFRKYKLEALLIALVIFGVLFLVATQWSWLGGICFGPRHLAPFVPLLTIPLAFAFKKFSSNVIVPFLILSIFVNFLSFQTYDLVYQGFDLNLFESFSEIPRKFFLVYNGHLGELDPSQFRNPLLEYNLPLFLRNGPRSKIFESLILFNTLDVRYVPHATITNSTKKLVFDRYIEPSELPLFFIPEVGILTLRVPFLCLIPLIVSISLIWISEIKRVFKRIDKSKKIIIFSCIIILFLLFFIRIRLKVYDKGWYPWQLKCLENNLVLSRYARPTASIILLGNEEILFFTRSFSKPNILELYLDGKYLGKYNIIPENYTKIYIPANKTNKNKIHFLLFSLKEECEILPEAAAPICFELSEAAI